jgi:hypothetical protein
MLRMTNVVVSGSSPAATYRVQIPQDPTLHSPHDVSGSSPAATYRAQIPQDPTHQGPPAAFFPSSNSFFNLSPGEERSTGLRFRAKQQKRYALPQVPRG